MVACFVMRCKSVLGKVYSKTFVLVFFHFSPRPLLNLLEQNVFLYVAEQAFFPLLKNQEKCLIRQKP